MFNDPLMVVFSKKRKLNQKLKILTDYMALSTIMKHTFFRSDIPIYENIYFTCFLLIFFNNTVAGCFCVNIELYIELSLASFNKS